MRYLTRGRWSLELTDIVYTSGLPRGRGTDDRTGADAGSRSTPGDHPPRSGGDRQRLGDVPLLRDHPSDLLRVAPPLREVRPGGPSGAITPPARQPECHEDGGRRQDRVPPPELPLRTPQDLDVPQAL